MSQINPQEAEGEKVFTPGYPFALDKTTDTQSQAGDIGTGIGRTTSRTSRTSRLGEALKHVRSVEAHPPAQHAHAHAHFDLPEDDSHVAREEGSAGGREKGRESAESSRSGQGAPPLPVIDIEHVPCEDDPREWSWRKKNLVLAMMTIAVLGPLIAPSIYNPVIDDIKADLGATDTQIGLSLSLYILFQGCIPVIWASTAEIIGRKPVYLSSYALYTIAAIVASRSSNIATLIGMRCVQAVGSAAVVSVGAGSLADIFEVHERGQKLGLFYGMPLLGPSLGPLIGGALGNSFGWRSSFYFLSAFAGIVEIMFLFFPDTWRRERSKVYQKAMENAIKRAMHADEVNEKKRLRKLAKGLSSTAPTPPATNPPTPGGHTRRTSHVSAQSTGYTSAATLNVDQDAQVQVEVDPEAAEVVVTRQRGWKRFFGKKREVEETGHAKIRPSVRDINPLPTMWSLLKEPTNAIILCSSGLLFAAQYTIPYTASVTLAAAPYNYNALFIGIIILSFGVGSIIGSFVGGKWSDVTLRRLRKANNGVMIPEMRLQSTIPAMPLIVASFLAYAWTAGTHTHIAGLIVSLVFCGLSLMLIYSSTLAYLVDANPGRSASAVSTNSFFRGISGCVLSQVAIPIQKKIGDGGLYSMIAGLLALSSAGILLLIWKGKEWRQGIYRWPWTRTKKDEAGMSDSEMS